MSTLKKTAKINDREKKLYDKQAAGFSDTDTTTLTVDPTSGDPTSLLPTTTTHIFAK